MADGAGEIDMVMNFGALKSGRAALVAAEIASIVRAVQGVPVKVILETAALSEDEKQLACRLARDAGVAFVKTSTGFHPSGGATVADVRLLRAAVGPAMGVKASGGIRNHIDARAMLDAGANRIGTSASAAILEQWEAQLSWAVASRYRPNQRSAAVPSESCRPRGKSACCIDSATPDALSTSGGRSTGAVFE